MAQKMFSEEMSSGNKIKTGDWRQDPIKIGTQHDRGNVTNVFYEGPMEVHVTLMMDDFLKWFGIDQPNMNPYVKAGVAHLWFGFIHPIEDGNGRIGRAICDLLLARANAKIINSVEPFHNLSSRIQGERHVLQIVQQTSKKYIEH